MKRFLSAGEGYARLRTNIVLLFFLMCLQVVSYGKAPYRLDDPSALTVKTDSVRPLWIGDPLPDYVWDIPLRFRSIADTTSQLITLRDYRDKVIILDFWATWCKPCVESIVKLQAILASFSKDDVFLLPIQVNDQEKRLAHFYKRSGMELYTVVGDTLLNALVQNYLSPFGVAWIVDGRLVGVPYRRDITPENIQKMISRESLTIDHRKRYGFLYNK